MAQLAVEAGGEPLGIVSPPAGVALVLLAQAELQCFPAISLQSWVGTGQPGC